MQDLDVYVPAKTSVVGREALGARSRVIRTDEFPPL
jgi:hypothetical protein